MVKLPCWVFTGMSAMSNFDHARNLNWRLALNPIDDDEDQIGRILITSQFEHKMER